MRGRFNTSTHVAVELSDIESCIRLISALTLPQETLPYLVEPLRAGLLTRLRRTIEDGART